MSEEKQGAPVRVRERACTEPPELDMPMRARREWRRMERLAVKWIPAEYPGTVEGLKQRRTALLNLLRDSGEPL